MSNAISATLSSAEPLVLPAAEAADRTPGFWARFLVALDTSRRGVATREIARYRSRSEDR